MVCRPRPRAILREARSIFDIEGNTEIGALGLWLHDQQIVGRWLATATHRPSARPRIPVAAARSRAHGDF
ncbi:hypothetical protein [Mycolicibacterium tusciae]|uniref:hypothetical protein n=1 Tax=Mycolicibacterium tusciae TaxID=75922 RepID=UPI0011E58649|nr:hypothetical protein [Mycolicibacterium tusciae]